MKNCCRYRAQEITIAVILCKYSHEHKRPAQFKLPTINSAPCPFFCRQRLDMAWLITKHSAPQGQAPKQKLKVGNQGSHKNSNSHIDASHSRQPLVKGERLVRYEVNAVMSLADLPCHRMTGSNGSATLLGVGACPWRLASRGLRFCLALKLSLGVSNLLLPLEGLGDGV